MAERVLEKISEFNHDEIRIAQWFLSPDGQYLFRHMPRVLKMISTTSRRFLTHPEKGAKDE